jgi:hypothetical protein
MTEDNNNIAAAIDAELVGNPNPFFTTQDDDGVADNVSPADVDIMLAELSEETLNKHPKSGGVSLISLKAAARRIGVPAYHSKPVLNQCYQKEN